jgi:hypothetical protein
VWQAVSQAKDRDDIDPSVHAIVYQFIAISAVGGGFDLLFFPGARGVSIG